MPHRVQERPPPAPARSAGGVVMDEQRVAGIAPELQAVIWAAMDMVDAMEVKGGAITVFHSRMLLAHGNMLAALLAAKPLLEPLEPRTAADREGL